jgi:hypothetical protein
LSNALIDYGHILHDGVFEEEAFSLFQRFSKLLWNEGYFWLGLCYIEGKSTSIKFLDGLDFVQQAAFRQYLYSALFYSSIQPQKYFFKF